MYPIIRLFTSIYKAKKIRKTNGLANMSELCSINLTCMPWDLDIFLEMNNGRVLTLYDLGRFDLSIKSGLSEVLKDKQWGLVVAGSTVRYRKRVRLFDKITMKTQLAGVDERWVYIRQSMWVKDQPVSSVLLRTGITAKGSVIATSDVLKAVNLTKEQQNIEYWQLDEWEESWVDSEAKRPWPPIVNCI